MNCPICNSPDRRMIEMNLHTNKVTPTFLETKYRWSRGSVITHMDEHVSYDPVEAAQMEKMRQESISTLGVAEDLVQRLVSWVDELEYRKESEGLTSEWIADATKLLSQGQGFLKEIGVDSQLLLADRKVDLVMGVLVDVLQTEPAYLDQIQLRLASMQPPSHVIDGDFEVLE